MENNAIDKRVQIKRYYNEKLTKEQDGAYGERDIEGERGAEGLGAEKKGATVEKLQNHRAHLNIFGDLFQLVPVNIYVVRL